MGKFPKRVDGFKINMDCVDEDTVYESREDANDAFENCVEEVTMWECSTCSERHDDKEDAYSCCD